MNKYAVGIVLYQPDKIVMKRACEYRKSFGQVLLVDNSDNNVARTFLKESKADVIYHSMGFNSGMSGALNYIYEWAIKNNVEFILTMDQDTEYNQNEIKNMIRFIEHDNSSAAIYSANYSNMYVAKGRNIPGRLNIPRNQIKRVLFSMTSGSWMNTKYLSEILPLENWFIGFVDYDVCANIKAKYNNVKFIRVGNSVMYQQVGESLQNNFFNRFFHVLHLSDERYYYMMRNIELFLKKYQDDATMVEIAKKQRLRILFNVFFEKDKKKIIQYIKCGVRDGKLGKMGRINGKI